MNDKIVEPTKGSIEAQLISRETQGKKSKPDVSVQVLQRSLKIQKRINKLLKKRAKDKVKAIQKSKEHGNNSQKSQDLNTSSKKYTVSKIEIEKTPLKDSNSERTSVNETLSHHTE